ncbi:hypothetical protein VW35_11365 [Devosia soli]|uniref:Uncharacterized protein n=1 Tax=Devosia soli TaxID=361041 RepID=A0A0F5L9F6_9HYPH|nr:hypothetical protein VW35_11365 [Devosia soli]
MFVFQNAGPSSADTTGLVPVVHGMWKHPMDCRDKPGNDEEGEVSWVANRGSRFRGNDTVMLGVVQ